MRIGRVRRSQEYPATRMQIPTEKKGICRVFQKANSMALASTCEAFSKNLLPLNTEKYDS